MAERPILFSAPMVRAILAGTKTQTRRAMRIQPHPFEGGISVSEGVAYWDGGANDASCACPYGAPGDRLWVRETWSRTNPGGADGVYFYRADDFYPECLYGPGKRIDPDVAWSPSIFMPRRASRITLEVTEVRVERLHIITNADAEAEGIAFDKQWEGYGIDGGRFFHCSDPRRSYEQLWESINGEGSWDANPWVWVIEFKPHQQGGENEG